MAVGVNVDGLDPLAGHRHGQGLARGLLGGGAVDQAAAAKNNAGGSANARFQKNYGEWSRLGPPSFVVVERSVRQAVATHQEHAWGRGSQK
jgi:hypothetical protein